MTLNINFIDDVLNCLAQLPSETLIKTITTGAIQFLMNRIIDSDTA